jgi:hypothetical protein
MTSEVQDRLELATRSLRRTDPRLAAQEREFLNKLAVCWRLRGMGTLFITDPASLSCHNQDQADALASELSVRGRWYVSTVMTMEASALGTLINKASLRLDKGKGAPFWFPSTERETPFATHRLYDANVDFEGYVQACAEAGQARMPALLQTSYIRIQSNRNVMPKYVMERDHLVERGTRIGPKVRRISAQPFIVNHLWAPVGNVLRTLMAESPDRRTTGTFGPAAAAAQGHKYTAAIDLKAYDTTVSFELLLAVHDRILVPVLNALVSRGAISAKDRSMLVDADLAAQEMAILLPPRSLDELAYVANARGQTRSGENLTSWKGTEINRARCNLKMRDVKNATGQATHSINYGDDTVVFANSAKAIDSWLESPEAYGFKEEAAADATFLMKRLPHGYSYLGRMIMGSLDREPSHEPETPVDAAAAFAIRRDLLTGHPSGHAYLSILSGLKAPERFETAVQLATQSSSSVALTLVASAMKEGKRTGNLTDDRLDALEALAEQPNVNHSTKIEAAQAIVALRRTLDLTNRQISWEVFRQKSAEMGLYQARSLIRAKSYAVGMQ